MPLAYGCGDKPAPWLRRAAVGVALAAGMAAGLGAAAAQDTVIIGMTDDLEFEPRGVTISAGDTVEWRNTSSVPHTATGDPDEAANTANVQLPQGAQPFDSGMIPAGASYSHTFEVPGRYQYVCLPHEAAGMIGEIIVQ